MKKFLYLIVLAGLGMSTGTVSAASGYVDSAQNHIVRTGVGDCLHTSRWSENNTVEECDPSLAEVAAVEILTQLQPIRLEADALFEFDSATLTDEGRARLDEALSQLPERSALQDKRITITGFTDRIGPEAYNQNLSERRAQAVHDYLVSRGMSDEAIDARGLGSANPLVRCEGKRGDALVGCLAPNRRTEIEFSAMEVVEVEEEVEVAP